MRYTVDEVSFDTAVAALAANDYGLHVVEDPCGVAYATIWTDNSYEDVKGQVGGFQVGSIARNAGAFAATYTLVMDEHLNDRKRMAGVFAAILVRTSHR